MGFRSNFIAGVSGYNIPEWFKEKYPTWSYCENNQSCVAQLWESKFYFSFKEDERITDIQKMLVENTDWGGKEIVIVLLHECGGITRLQVTRTDIIATEPTAWKKVDGVEHNYCYGCSDYKPTKKEAWKEEIYNIITHNETSECHLKLVVLVESLTSQVEALVRGEEREKGFQEGKNYFRSLRIGENAEELVKNTRNAVLSEVEREWFKAKAETFSGQNEAENCIETIINNLRVK